MHACMLLRRGIDERNSVGGCAQRWYQRASCMKSVRIIACVLPPLRLLGLTRWLSKVCIWWTCHRLQYIKSTSMPVREHF